MINFMDIDYCTSLGPIVNIVQTIIKVIQFGIPVVLIIFGMMDLGKAVMAGKEDEMKKAQSTLIKRVIYAVLVFLVVTIVLFVMNIVADSGADGVTNSGADGVTNDWYSCIFGSSKTNKVEDPEGN